MRLKPSLLSLLLIINGLVLSWGVPWPAEATVGRPTPRAPQEPVTTHPRLWITQADLPGLRARAVNSNPFYAQALLPLAQSYKSKMDDNSLYTGDKGGNYGYTPYPVEWGAELFAFMSLIENDSATRADYADRAHTLLMYMMNKAVLGPTDADIDYRGRVFSKDMRSLFYGEAFPITVDWIYQTLTAQDKATIRAVFLRWQKENLTATTSGFDHPEPMWVLNDPALLSDPYRFRTAANNFYLAHMNQIGLMALSFDAADDPGDVGVNDDQVRDYLTNAIGAWLYVHHKLSQTDASGAIPPEGTMYGPTGVGRAAEFMLALHTAGYTDTVTWGEQVNFNGAEWQAIIPAQLHVLPPAPALLPDVEYKGPLYAAADHGDAQDAWAPDMMTMLGAMGLHAQAISDTQRLATIRWMETNLAPGGATKLIERAGDWNHVRDCLFYFMLFDPAAPTPADPRPAYPTNYFAPGVGRILSRTGWEANASFFTYHLGWSLIDHQHQTGNMFEFFRQGEWLTKQWAGYGSTAGASDYKNTLALQNDPLTTNSFSFWNIDNAHGSQYRYVGPNGDPNLLAHSFAPSYTYALGDATNLYNRPDFGPDDITEATRSILWLKPDTIVVYDRAASDTAGRFKRFWLGLPAAPVIIGQRATMTSPKGQQLVIDTLLPTAATVTTDTQKPNDQGYDETAVGETMRVRLKVEAPGGPATTRFLHVLQGLDGNATPLATTNLATSGTPFAGVILSDTAVLFPVNVGHIPTGDAFAGATLTSTTYLVPSGVKQHYITGLTPNTAYTVVTQTVTSNVQITLTPGGALYVTDGGGVLSFTLDTTPLPLKKLYLPLMRR